MVESVIRTFVPIVYALLIKAGLGQLGVDDALLQNFAAAVVTAAVYAAIRYAESHQKQFGWLLGVAKAPTYPED